MNGQDHENEAMPVIMILERRTQRRGELSCTEVMKILRKRAAKNTRREPGGADPAG